MARSARPVIPPLLISSTRYQASRASRAPTPTAEAAGRSPHGTEVPRRHAPTGQAIRAVKGGAAPSPGAAGPPACPGFAGTSTAAAPAAARISRPASAAGRSARAVATPQAPVTANAATVTQRSATPGSVRVLTVLASQLKDEGCRAAASVRPPTKATKAAAAVIRPHQGTKCPAARAGENQVTPPSGSRLLAAFIDAGPIRVVCAGQLP